MNWMEYQFRTIKIQKRKLLYIGNAHNPFDILNLTLNKIDERNYRAIGKIMVDFEHEMVAKNEIFEFETTIEFKKTE